MGNTIKNFMCKIEDNYDGKKYKRLHELLQRKRVSNNCYLWKKDMSNLLGKKVCKKK